MNWMCELDVCAGCVSWMCFIWMCEPRDGSDCVSFTQAA